MFVEARFRALQDAPNDSSSKMNWIAQLTNIVSQGALLLGVLILHKAGLDK